MWETLLFVDFIISFLSFNVKLCIVNAFHGGSLNCLVSIPAMIGIEVVVFVIFLLINYEKTLNIYSLTRRTKQKITYTWLMHDSLMLN